MARRITNGSQPAPRAARHGIELAKALNAKVTVMMVTTPWATNSPGSRRWWRQACSSRRTSTI
jgi:hypothetical protein